MAKKRPVRRKSAPKKRPLPKRFVKFTEEFPDIAYYYQELGAAVHEWGPLDKRERALIKLALSFGGRLEGGAHSHIRKALEAGATPAELKHIAVLAIPTIGFPSAMAAMSWIDDVLLDRPKRKR